MEIKGSVWNLARRIWAAATPLEAFPPNCFTVEHLLHVRLSVCPVWPTVAPRRDVFERSEIAPVSTPFDDILIAPTLIHLARPIALITFPPLILAEPSSGWIRAPVLTAVRSRFRSKITELIVPLPPPLLRTGRRLIFFGVLRLVTSYFSSIWFMTRHDIWNRTKRSSLLSSFFSILLLIVAKSI